ARVVEHDHSVAQQAPSLLRVEGDGAGGVAVPVVSRGARGLVGTHGAPLLWGCRCSGSCGGPLPRRCASPGTRAAWRPGAPGSEVANTQSTTHSALPGAQTANVTAPADAPQWRPPHSFL